MGSAQSITDQVPLTKAVASADKSNLAKRRSVAFKQPKSMQSRLTAKGQMTLPKEARDFLGLKPGDKVKFFFGPDGRLSILPMIPITALKGIVVSKRDKPVTLEEMDEAIAAGAVERYKRFLGQSSGQ